MRLCSCNKEVESHCGLPAVVLCAVNQASSFHNKSNPVPHDVKVIGEVALGDIVLTPASLFIAIGWLVIDLFMCICLFICPSQTIYQSDERIIMTLRKILFNFLFSNYTDLQLLDQKRLHITIIR